MQRVEVDGKVVKIQRTNDSSKFCSIKKSSNEADFKTILLFRIVGKPFFR